MHTESVLGQILPDQMDQTLIITKSHFGQFVMLSKNVFTIL